ncbi:hypothetical protein ACU8KH_01670 [Lachancea thermotolerans]
MLGYMECSSVNPNAPRSGVHQHGCIRNPGTVNTRPKTTFITAFTGAFSQFADLSSGCELTE